MRTLRLLSICGALGLLVAATPACKGDKAAPARAPSATPHPASKLDAAPKSIPPKAKAVMDVTWSGKKLNKDVHGAAVENAAADGAVAAMGWCNDAKVVSEIAALKGVTLGRATLKPRNPANTGPDWVQEFLAKQGETVSTQGLKSITEIVPVEGGESARFLRRIRVEEGCLGCHGADLDPAVVAELKAKYPEDKAVGYKVGDLRGVVWAEKAVAGEPKPEEATPAEPKPTE